MPFSSLSSSDLLRIRLMLLNTWHSCRNWWSDDWNFKHQQRTAICWRQKIISLNYMYNRVDMPKCFWLKLVRFWMYKHQRFSEIQINLPVKQSPMAETSWRLLWSAEECETPQGGDPQQSRRWWCQRGGGHTVERPIGKTIGVSKSYVCTINKILLEF